jgi:2-dehydro-3-deoxyphosphogluconate aldolase / (4S)-4-hydroxy-2-oxoglutarate aldolase
MAKHARLETLTRMKKNGLIPVFYNADIEIVKSVVKACYAGGASVIEFTNRGDRAVDVFRELAVYRDKELSEMIIGAGSIFDASTAALYIAAGADFVVGPVFDSDVAKVCNAHKIPYCPGCGSVTEIHQAHLLGVEICKIFPGAQVGGPAFVKAVKGPCPWADLMPTGGVAPTRESITEWFSAGIACAGIGSNLITKELVAAKDYTAIQKKVADVVGFIREFRLKNSKIEDY